MAIFDSFFDLLMLIFDVTLSFDYIFGWLLALTMCYFVLYFLYHLIEVLDHL